MKRAIAAVSTAAALLGMLTILPTPAQASVPSGYAQLYGRAYWDRDKNNKYASSDTVLPNVTVQIRREPKGACGGETAAWCISHSTTVASGKSNSAGNYRFNIKLATGASYIAYWTQTYDYDAYYATLALHPHLYAEATGLLSKQAVHIDVPYRYNP